MDSWADPDWRSEPLCRGGAINTDPGQPDRKDAFHAGMAVTIDPDGCLNDVDLGDPDLRLEHLRRLIGCAAVHPIPLADDLLIWVADRTDGLSLNVAATDLVMITASIPNQTIYGTIVCTGGSVHGTDITPIAARWARYLANHQAVRPMDAAFHPIP